MSTNQAILGSSNKLDIIKCIKPSVVQDEEIVFDCKIFGGWALAHLLKSAPFSLHFSLHFLSICRNNLIQYICVELTNVNFIDIVWNQYFDKSLKNTIRGKRAGGVRRKVTPQTVLPNKWIGSLRNYSRKKICLIF